MYFMRQERDKSIKRCWSSTFICDWICHLVGISLQNIFTNLLLDLAVAFCYHEAQQWVPFVCLLHQSNVLNKQKLTSPLPGQVHGQSVQQLSVFLCFLHQRNLGVDPTEFLHFLCQRSPGAVKLGRQPLVLLGKTLKRQKETNSTAATSLLPVQIRNFVTSSSPPISACISCLY